MGGRLAEAAEHDRLEMGEAPEPGGEAVERRLVHVAHRLVPGVADAGPAGQIAARGRLDIETVQAVDVGQDLGPAAVEDDLEAGAGGEAELFLELGRDRQGAVLDPELVDVPRRGAAARGQAPFPFLEVGQEPRPLGHVQGELLSGHGINI